MGTFCGLTRVFLCIFTVCLEAHCAFFDIYNITYIYKKKLVSDPGLASTAIDLSVLV
jgi:hypothetical protein